MPGIGLASRLTRGAFYQTANAVCRGLFAFLLTPVTIHALGNRWYGFWILLVSFLGSYELFDLGISVAVSRYVSRAFGSGDDQEMNRVLTTAFGIFLLFGAAIGLITVAAAAASPLFLADPGEIRLCRAAILLLGFGLALNFPMKIFRGVLVTHVRYDILNQISLARIVLSSALIYALLTAGHGLIALALVTVLSRIAEAGAIILWAKRVWPPLALRPAYLQRSIARQLFDYGLKAFAAQIADVLRFKVDSLVIATVLNLNLVTVYAIGQKLANTGKELVHSALNVMIPVFSRYEGRNDYQSIREKYQVLTRFGAVVAVFMGGSMVIYGRDLIQRWVGPEFAGSYRVLVILCVPLVVELTQSIGIQLLYGISKHHYYAAVNVAEGLVNIALSLVLARYYGIYGVALGTAIEMVVFKSAILPWIVCREIGLPLREYYLKSLLGPLVKMLVPLVAFKYLAQPLVRPEYLRIALVGALQTLVFLPIVYFLVLNGEERRLVRAGLARNR